jgi:hypothetical protein
MVINGFFTSIWEEGTIETPATLDLETGFLDVTFSNQGSEYENLNKEEFVSIGGKVYNICPNCHQYVTKLEMHDDNVGNGLSEVEVCRGTCEN